jgi:hypothetical protein
MPYHNLFTLPRLRRAKEALRYFLSGRSHPSQLRVMVHSRLWSGWIHGRKNAISRIPVSAIVHGEVFRYIAL